MTRAALGLIRRQAMPAGLIMDLNFGAGQTDRRMSFAGGANGSRIGAARLPVAASTPRIDCSTSTAGQFVGLRVEKAATNLLVNATIDGANLATQSLSVTAQAYTLSFYGTGSIALSGAASATLTGDAVYPSRKTLTFTPSAGTLTLTVTGTVQYAQLETGTIATSFVATGASAVLRSADLPTISGSALAQVYNAAEGTMILNAELPALVNGEILCIDDGSGNNTMEIYRRSSTTLALFVRSGNVGVADLPTTATFSGFRNVGIRWKANDFAICVGGATPATLSSGAVPVAPTIMRIGHYRGAGSEHNARIARVLSFNRAMANAELQAWCT
ncbi:MAG: hypothetical protein KAY22_06570 [Rhizorhabdus sp.]|uniref:hypothetical protein n=1 Tax=Rhizorhabdus sp. TaxID=1968843 RepID=UPI001B677096|nr:hypothetical protein [Rhizorhabdus sp.]MBP8231952.1 hypothetical protein [Rhizorhabdus sp.]